MRCEYCGLKLGTKSSDITHINITQAQKEHYFCSELCKNKWCFRIQKSSYVVLILWSIGKFRDRYFFVKKKRKTNSLSSIGMEGSKSYFTSPLRHIELLIYKKIAGRDVLIADNKPV